MLIALCVIIYFLGMPLMCPIVDFIVLKPRARVVIPLVIFWPFVVAFILATAMIIAGINSFRERIWRE